MLGALLLAFATWIAAATAAAARNASCPVLWAEGRAPLVVTLSAVPGRLWLLSQNVRVLQQQTHPPDEIVVNLAKHYPRFPEVSEETIKANAEAALAAFTGSAQSQQAQVTVRWLEDDLGPGSKVVPTAVHAAEHASRWAARESARNAVTALAEMGIVVVDDDQEYDSDLICQLVSGAVELQPHLGKVVLGFRGFAFADEKGRRWQKPRSMRTDYCIGCNASELQRAREFRPVKILRRETSIEDACATLAAAKRIPRGWSFWGVGTAGRLDGPTFAEVDVLTVVGGVLLPMDALGRALPLLSQSLSPRRQRRWRGRRRRGRGGAGGAGLLSDTCSAEQHSALRYNDDLALAAALSLAGVRRIQLGWRPTPRGAIPNVEMDRSVPTFAHGTCARGCGPNQQGQRIDGSGLRQTVNRWASQVSEAGRKQRSAGSPGRHMLQLLLNCTVKGKDAQWRQGCVPTAPAFLPLAAALPPRCFGAEKSGHREKLGAMLAWQTPQFAWREKIAGVRLRALWRCAMARP